MPISMPILNLVSMPISSANISNIHANPDLCVRDARVGSSRAVALWRRISYYKIVTEYGFEVLRAGFRP